MDVGHQSDTPVRLPKNRTFGLFFCGVFSLLGIYGFTLGSGSYGASIALGVAALLAIVTWLKADSLAPLNRAWYRLGILLSKIVSPIVLGLLFFGMITPIAVVTRFLVETSLSCGRAALTLILLIVMNLGQIRTHSTISSEGIGMRFIVELWTFLKIRKKLWLMPVIVVMVALGGLLLLTQGSVVAPFIYTLF